MILAATWDSERLGAASRELLGAAARLGSDLDVPVALVSLGGAAAAAEAGAYGVPRAFHVADGHVSSGNEGAVAALAELAGELDARAVLLPADERTAEVAPRLAERAGGTAILQVTGIEARDGALRWTRPVFGGKALAEVVASAEPVVATLRRGAFAAPERAEGRAEVSTREAPATAGAVELLGAEAPEEGDSLESAKVIVSGGAGLGDGSVFAQLEELASLLGGAVGASLAAVDAGWAPPERQVGLTGKVVSPDVYFALGISGASQHLAGIGGAKAVVAVNTDPDAPIFSVAKLGVVMDCRAFATAMIERLRAR